MNVKIIIVGSTGKLGTKLLNFTNKNSIPIYGITCFTNSKKLIFQQKKYSIKNSFVLSRKNDQLRLIRTLKSKISIIYFLDFGSYSLKYLNHFLNFNHHSIIAIANKEMIIAGGKLLQSKIKKNNNTFIPLDSEHFSLSNLNLNNSVQKIFITASGGPFYFKKSVNLSSVSLKKVLSHPKWKMGNNNLIDSSNFINKILEIYELSYIFNIPLDKIDFLISKEAYVHSIVHFNDNTMSMNCFINDMLITLIKPLSFFYKIQPLKPNYNYLSINNLKIEKPNDPRFQIFKYKKKLMNLTHSEQIKLMIINNSAHKLYLSNKLKYDNIVNYIMKELNNNRSEIKLNSFANILKFISKNNKLYKTDV